MNTIVAQAAAGRPAPVAPRGDTLQLAQFARLLRRHMWLIGLCALIAAVAAYGYARTLPKTFTATSSITVEGDRFAIPELQGALRSDAAPDPMPWVRTEVQALTSRTNVASVVKQLDLAALPEFNADLRPKTMTQQAKDAVTGWVRQFLPEGPADGPAVGPDEGVLNAAMKALAVFQDNRSLVIEASFTSQDPRLAASFLNTLVDNYVRTRAQRRGQANEGANQVMTQRIEEVRADLAKIEQQMHDLRSKNEMVAVRAGGVGQQQVEELTTAAARATLERSQLEANYDRATTAAKQGSADALASVLSSPTISRLREQVAQSSQRMAELSTRYGPGYPGVRSASAELASANRQVGEEAGRIIASLGAQLRVARQQEADIKKQLDDSRRTGAQAENTRAQLDQMQQEANSRRALYQTLLERAQQTVAGPAAAETPDVRILSPATPPGLPSGPNMKLAALMGGAGGMLFGGLIALLRVRSVDGFENAGEVTFATGLPVLATLPRTLIGRRRGMLSTRAVDAQASPDAEAMRALRGRLRFAGRTGAPRSALFVPVADGDAAAATAAAIAACFARVAAADGERVLLIEGDLHAHRGNAGMADVLGFGRRGAAMQGGGLEHALGAEDWRDVVEADRQPGLDLLLAARSPSGGQTGSQMGAQMAGGPALLRGMHFQNLLIEAREDYDLIVMGAPSAGQSDAATLAQRADAVVLIVDGLVGRAATREAATRLSAAVRTPLVSILLARR